MQSIPELVDRLPVYRESVPIITKELLDFEAEYDDLCASSDILKRCMEKHGEVIKKNRPFERQLKSFKRDVSELKEEYEECLKQDLTRYLL